MDVTLWVAAGLLAAVFAMAGTAKLVLPRGRLVDQGQAWAGEFTNGAVKLIGLCEVLGAVGLILPPIVDVAPVLTPVAAAGLALTMVGAAVVHYRRGEVPNIVINVVLASLATFVAVMRFGPHAL